MTSAAEFDDRANQTNPPFLAGDRESLDSWLDFHRATLLSKCAGLSDAHMRMRSVPPSSLSLLGLLRHMTEVERVWFRLVLTGADLPLLYDRDDNADAVFDDIDSADVAASMAAFREEVQVCRQVAAEHPDLEVIAKRHRHGEEVSLRWIYVHMIEEYARHNGHADLIRECIDGATES